MSYDIEIVDTDGQLMCAASRHQLRGGTYCLGGTDELRLNITYNYAPYFYKAFGEKGIRSLYGKKVVDTVGDIAKAIQAVGEMQDIEGEQKARVDEIAERYPDADDEAIGLCKWEPDNYWTPTRANAQASLQSLLALAGLGLGGIWAGD